MSLTTEYKKQFAWRDWNRALSQCPITPGQRVLDLGCGPGDLSFELEQRGALLTGVDSNEELLAAARKLNPRASFLNQDLRSLSVEPKSFDGLWCSFSSAYFTDFSDVFSSWTRFLKDKAWVCVTDIDDLFGHEPLPMQTRQLVEDFYDDSLKNRRYDFRAGQKIQAALERSGFKVTTFTLADQELSFSGPASPEILQAWKDRLARMAGMKAFMKDRFDSFKNEFILCLESEQHQSRCKVVCCVGIR